MNEDSILAHLPYEPIEGQRRVISSLAAFVASGSDRDVVLLDGYAGTGKTSLTGAFVKALADHKVKTVVLAPTGRAAKVASRFAAGKAWTIHKRIYRADSPEPDAGYMPAVNKDRNTVFIVDEASLIGDNRTEGSLLEHLVRHVYSAPGCRMVLLGDTAQLPPVGQTESAAMSPGRLRRLGLNPWTLRLDTPVRQSRESGILYNDTLVREALLDPERKEIPVLEASRFPDMEIVGPAELADSLAASWSDVGVEDTLLITRSNKRAGGFNRAVRGLVMMAEEPLERGDRIVISKNDYYWSRINKLGQFVANGDVAVVDWVGNLEKMYGRWFCDAELSFPADDTHMNAKIMLKSLGCDGPSLPRADMEGLYKRIMESVTDKSAGSRIREAVANPYFNALQAKYAYCVTCHKAQGGQWRHVYIDMGGIDLESMAAYHGTDPVSVRRDFLRWLYTALTRATEKVYLVSPGKMAR